MRHYSIRWACLFLLLLCCSAAPAPKASMTHATHYTTFYYWYFYPDDTYNDEQTISDEEAELWIYFGVMVDTNSSGGTLVAQGYQQNTYPHTSFPQVNLYAHY